MKEDFGVARRQGGRDGNAAANFTDLTGAAPPARIHTDKYLPASEIAARRAAAEAAADGQGEALAIAMPQSGMWGGNQLFAASQDSDSSDSSGSHDYYPDDGSGADGADDDGDKSSGSKDGKPSRRDPFTRPFLKAVAWLKGRSRLQWLIAGSALLVLAGGTASFILTRPAKTPPPAPVHHTRPAAKAPTPPAKPVSPLTGLETTEADTKRPVIGVMIENTVFARPQSGLKDAGVVYEAIAEAGITRFLALFQEADPANIGPIRSARPYYVDWGHSYDAGYAHVGGSPDALSKIKTDGIRDLDQFFNSGSYHRISQREAPHNVYTSMQSLRDLMAAKGYTGSNFTPWPRKKEAPAKSPSATAIDIAISGPTYNVHYDYDAASNSYLRSEGGAPHTDADSGARLAPKVVIGLAAPYSLMADNYHSSYITVGSGTAKIFQDGTETDVTWKRNGNQTYQFLSKDNQPFKLDPGQTWITVVGDPGAVTFSGPAPTTVKPQ